jgi:hypothetical protein
MIGSVAVAATPPVSSRKTASGSSTAMSASKSPSLDAARNASIADPQKLARLLPEQERP